MTRGKTDENNLKDYFETLMENFIEQILENLQQSLNEKLKKHFGMTEKMFGDTFMRRRERKLKSMEMNLHANLQRNLKIYLEEEICEQMNCQAFKQHVDRKFDNINTSMDSFIRTGINSPVD